MRVYVHLGRRDGGAGVWASIDSMAKVCLLRPETVRRALRGLQERGMIRRVDRPGFTTIFHVTPVEQWASPPPAFEAGTQTQGGCSRTGEPRPQTLGHPPCSEPVVPLRLEGVKGNPPKGIQENKLAPLACAAGVSESRADKPASRVRLVIPEELREASGFLQTWEEWLHYQLERNRGRTPTIITLEKHLQICAKLGRGKAIGALKSAMEKGWAAPDENPKVALFDRPRDEAPDNWKAIWREEFPPEDFPDAPRYEEGEWKDVRNDHKQLIRDLARKRQRRSA